MAAKPNSVSVLVAGATIIAPEKANKAGTGTWYQAKFETPLPDDGRTPEEILASAARTVRYDGEKLPLSSNNSDGLDALSEQVIVVTYDAPRFHRNGTKIAGSGGRPTVVFVKRMAFDNVEYQLLVILKVYTLSAGKKLRVTVQMSKAISGGSFTPVGNVEGAMSL